MHAIKVGETKIVQLLLECGADVNLQDESGSTALMLAYTHKRNHIVSVLLQNNADTQIKNWNGKKEIAMGTSNIFVLYNL